jgi:hypothetical protein
VAERARPGALLLAAAAVLLAGCSSGSGSGPIASGGTGSQCLAAGVGKLVTVGSYDLHNTGKSPAKITGIRLPHNHGLRVTSAWLTPILTDSNGDQDEIGVGYSWPPSFDKLARKEWAQRVPLIGAVVKPGQDPNLSFGVARTGARGTADGPLVTYTSDGHTYTASFPFAIVVAARCGG